MAANDSTPASFTITGPIERADLGGLTARICALLERTHCESLMCETRGVDADAVAVDALARLQLAASRHGCQIRLRGASSELLELIAFMGLEDVLPG